MPSTGIPILSTAGSHFGASLSYTELGPPDRITPAGSSFPTSSTAVVHGRIAEKTPCSLTRRAISCVYCPPKSSTTMPPCSAFSGCSTSHLSRVSCTFSAFIPVAPSIPTSTSQSCYSSPTSRGESALSTTLTSRLYFCRPEPCLCAKDLTHCVLPRHNSRHPLPAAGRQRCVRGFLPHSTTIFSNLSCTYTTLSIFFPFKYAATPGFASPSFTTSPCDFPVATFNFPLSLPLTCTTISTSSSFANSALYPGHPTVHSPPVCPSISHNSSARCGVIGASINVRISSTSLRTSGRTPSSAAYAAFVNSIICAIAELKCHRVSKSCVTRRSVWCVFRSRPFSFSVIPSTLLL